LGQGGVFRWQRRISPPLAIVWASFETCPTGRAREGGRAKHWSKRALLLWGCPRLVTGGPQPKVGGPGPDMASETYCRDMQKEGSSRRWSNLSRLPHVRGEGARQRPWFPQQPKVGLLEPDMARLAETDEVKQDCDTDSAVSDIEEDVQVLIGGHDETSAWRYGKQGHAGWSRVAGGLESSVRLSDIRALPHGNAGKLLSFGSLGHLVHNERCKACVFHRRKSCRHSWLCTFCHGHRPHMRARPPQQKQRREHQSDSVMAINSDTQNAMCKGTVLGTRSGSLLVTLCWRYAALLVVVAGVLLALQLE